MANFTDRVKAKSPRLSYLVRDAVAKDEDLYFEFETPKGRIVYKAPQGMNWEQASEWAKLVKTEVSATWHSHVASPPSYGVGKYFNAGEPPHTRREK